MAISEADFSVSVSDLFDVIVDPETYPRWLIGTRRIRAVSDDWPSPQSSFKHSVGFGLLMIADVSTLRAIQPPVMMELLVRARPVLEAVVRFELAPTSAGSRLTMRETPIGVCSVLAAVAQPLIQARNEASLHRLRALVEPDRPHPLKWVTR